MFINCHLYFQKKALTDLHIGAKLQCLTVGCQYHKSNSNCNIFSREKCSKTISAYSIWSKRVPFRIYLHTTALLLTNRDIYNMARNTNRSTSLFSSSNIHMSCLFYFLRTLTTRILRLAINTLFYFHKLGHFHPINNSEVAIRAVILVFGSISAARLGKLTRC